MDSRRSSPATTKSAEPIRSVSSGSLPRSPQAGSGVGQVPRPGRSGEIADDPLAARRRLERVMDHLDRGLDEMKIEYEKFFSGALKLPPDSLRTAIHRDLRLLRNQNLRSTVEQFRLAGLEARFNSLNELYTRRVREHEEGRSAAARAPVVAPKRRFDADKGILLAGPANPEDVGALFEELRRRGGAANGLDAPRFAAYLEQQAASIRSRTGCDAVQFRLAEEDGRVKLKARPVPTPGG